MLTWPVRAATSASAFDEGVALTREGQFEPALERFLAAQGEGDRSTRLAFNLGVVYYRLQRFKDAQIAFERAAQGSETRDLAQYNLGLVALAVDDRAQAERWFRLTAEQAKEPALRALGTRALEEALGVRAPRSARASRGSLSLLRAHDSNVLIPVGAISDLPSSIEDSFWEMRGGWADTLGTAVPGLGYRLAALAVEYDDVEAADLAVVEIGVDWRGPATIGASLGTLLVGDRGYQRSLDLRARGPLLERERIGVYLDGGFTRLNSMDARARDLEGSQYSVGASAEGGTRALALHVGYLHVENDRFAASLSPTQRRSTLRLRLAFGQIAARAWARYTDSDYPTGRDDHASEFGADVSIGLHPRWDWLVEATRLDNRSDTQGFEYDTERIYTGLRLRF